MSKELIDVLDENGVKTGEILSSIRKGGGTNCTTI